MEVSVTAFVECANRLIHVLNASTLHSTICCRRLNHWHVLNSKRLQTCSKNKSIRATKASAPQHLSLLARLPCKGCCVQNKPALTFCVDFNVLLSVHPFRSWLSWKCDSCWVWMSRLEFGFWTLQKKNMATMKGLQVLKLSRLAAWCAIPTVFCQDRAWTSKNGPSFDSFVWQQHVQWSLFQKRDFMRCPCHHVHVFECNGLK